MGDRPADSSNKMVGVIVASFAGAVVLAGGYTLLESRWQISDWLTEPSPESTASAPAFPPPVVEPSELSAPEVSPYFDIASSLASEAAQKIPIAQTEQDWQTVINLWLEAIANMQEVPQSDPNWQAAQEKIEEYRNNLNYAIRRTIQLPN